MLDFDFLKKGQAVFLHDQKVKYLGNEKGYLNVK